MPVFWAFGADVLNDAGEPTVDSPEAIAALEFFLEMRRFAPEGVTTYNATELRDALLQGAVAMATEVWPAWIADLDNPEVSQVAGNVTLMPPPGQRRGSSPMLGSWLLGVSPDSANLDLAVEFLTFITSNEIQKAMALDVGLPPSRVSVYQDPEVISAYHWYPAELEALQSAVPRPRITRWSEVEAILGDYLQLALIDQMTAEEALEEANREIAAALRR
jgi:multiple sugar transport system substrate-binding protein